VQFEHSGAVKDDAVGCGQPAEMWDRWGFATADALVLDFGCSTGSRLHRLAAACGTGVFG
jgi:hypothetical protein